MGRSGRPHVAQATGNAEWWTPEWVVRIARSTMGGIDLDPASCEEANKAVGATTYYDRAGIDRPWFGRVWLNPPYGRGQIEPFIERALRAWKDHEIEQECVLVNNATETTWAQALLQACTAVCFLCGRVRFGGPNGVQRTPLQGQMLLFFGPEVRVRAFRAMCEALGVVYGHG